MFYCFNNVINGVDACVFFPPFETESYNNAVINGVSIVCVN